MSEDRVLVDIESIHRARIRRLFGFLIMMITLSAIAYFAIPEESIRRLLALSGLISSGIVGLYTLAYVQLRLSFLVRIRIVSTADWTTLRLINGSSWSNLSVVHASDNVTVAEFDGEKFRLIQPLEQAQNGQIAEMVVEFSLPNPRALSIVEILPLPRRVVHLVFELGRGHLGWAHVQMLNKSGEEPIVIDNFWWCGITGSPNARTIETPRDAYTHVASPRNPPERNATTLNDKVLFGYQGWFGCPGDGSDMNSWVHWFTTNIPDEEHLGVDLWPDMSELSGDERFTTRLLLPNGSNAEVFSSYKKTTVVRHFRWMESSDLDGVVLQRFVEDLDDVRVFCFRNQVLQNVQIGAEEHRRCFAVMYDTTGHESNAIEMIKADWQFLVEVLKITESPNYLKHKGRPVIGIWGLGFRFFEVWDMKYRDRYPVVSSMAADLVQWLHEYAPLDCRAAIIAGVPYQWRWIGKQPTTEGQGWNSVFSTVDVICPWSVGVWDYQNLAGSNDTDGTPFLKYAFQAEIKHTSELGQDYMPVVWPGFSWRNLMFHRENALYPANQVKRNGGFFFLNQVEIAASADVRMLYVAMFDEVDEGTAMFKVIAKTQDLPIHDPPEALVALDIDGHDLPSDYYLRLSRHAGDLLRE